MNSEFAYVLYINNLICSVDPLPPKLRVSVKYYIYYNIVHMYSMPYYTYGSTDIFIFRAYSTYISQKNSAVTRIYVVLEILKLNK